MVKKIALEHWLKPEQGNPKQPQLFCIFTDEPLFLTQGSDLYRTRLRLNTHFERQVIDADRNLDPQAFLALFSEVSLFGDLSLVELRLTQPKMSKDLAEAIDQVCRWMQQGQCDHCLLVTGPRLNKTQEKSAGFSSLLSTGTELVCKAITSANMAQWISQSAERLGLKMSPDGSNWLAERTEGNLLAAHQALEKLAVEHQGAISLEQVQHVASDAARYNVFDLGPSLLAADTRRISRMIDGLRAEGESTVLVLWALQEEIRAIRETRLQMHRGLPLAQACQQARIWGARQQHIGSALKRHNSASLEELTRWCYTAEKTIKGLLKGEPWTLLELIGMGIAGVSPPARIGIES